MKTRYDKDGDVVELGDDFFQNAKPLDAFPELKSLVGKRGKQKAPTKEPVSIRLSPEVTAHFRATGKGWQQRIDDVLREYVARHS